MNPCPLRRLTCLAALGTALFAFPASAADLLYQTGFEPPAFTAGQPIRGQDHWEMFHDGEAIAIATTNAHSGQQCLRMDGALLEQVGPDAVRAYCFSRALEGATNPPPIVEIRARVRLDGPQTGTLGTPEQDLLSANLMAAVPTSPTTAVFAGGFYVSSGGRIWAFSAFPGEDHKFSVPYTLGTYRSLAVRVDFVARRITYFVDDLELGSSPIAEHLTADRLSSGYLVMSGPLEPVQSPGLTYDRSNYTAWFDDYSIASIPLSPVNAVIDLDGERFVADESDPVARVRVLRRGFVNAPVRVTVSTADDTATAGRDYQAISTFVAFAAGETNKVVEIPLRAEDDLAERDQTFTVELGGLPPGATSAVPKATVFIRDDERPGSIDRTWHSTLGLPPFDPREPRYPDAKLVLHHPDGRMILSVDVYDETLGYPQFFRLLRILPDGSVDPTYPVRDTHPSAPSSHLVQRKVHPLPDGGLLVFDTEYAASHTARVRFRLDPNGMVDDAFPSLTSTSDFDLVPQPDGKILVGSAPGVGTWVPVRRNGQNLPRYSRLHADGSVDATFNPPSNLGGRLRLMPNGQLYLEALYAPPYRLYRLQTDGALDSTFNAPANLALKVHHVLPDGAILATASSTGSESLYRLLPNGTRDPRFTVGAAAGQSVGISAILVRPEGRLVLAGVFRTYQGQTRNGIVGLNADGSLDPTFQSGQALLGLPWDEEETGQAHRLLELPGGRMLVDGAFARYDGEKVIPPIVLEADGRRDTSFEGSLTRYPADLGGVSTVYTMAFSQGTLLVLTDEAELLGLRRLRMDLPLRILAQTRSDAGATRITANALARRRYTLQASPDLAAWTDVATATATTNQVEFAEAPGPTASRRFFRVKTP